jgi:carbon-monoxide dehydrogenase large subunit
LCCRRWKGYAKRKRASEKAGKLRGRSVCYYIEFGGIFNDRMDIRFDPGGTVTVFGGTHSHGQGHATVFAQLVHEFLGVPFDQIRYVQGDTAQVQFGRGTYGARSEAVRSAEPRMRSSRRQSRWRPPCWRRMRATSNSR